HSISALAIDPKAPLHIYAAVSGIESGVFESLDGGANWSPASSGLPSFPGPTALVVDPETPNTLYVATRFGVFKTVNAGANWSASTSGLPANLVLALAIDSQRPTTLYAGMNGGGVFKSSDGGMSWRSTNIGLPSFGPL